MKEDEFSSLTDREESAASEPLQEAVRAFLRELGEDPTREGLLRAMLREFDERIVINNYLDAIRKVGEV